VFEAHTKKGHSKLPGAIHQVLKNMARIEVVYILVFRVAIASECTIKSPELPKNNILLNGNTLVSELAPTQGNITPESEPASNKAADQNSGKPNEGNIGRIELEHILLVFLSGVLLGALFLPYIYQRFNLWHCYKDK